MLAWLPGLFPRDWHFRLSVASLPFPSLELARAGNSGGDGNRAYPDSRRSGKGRDLIWSSGL